MNSAVTSRNEFLVLKLDNELPFSVADLASLYRALARDYRKYSRGHELTIVKISEGSLISIFKDAVDLASGTNILINFGKTLAGLLSIFSKGSETDLPKSNKTGASTVEKLAQIAAKSRGGIQIKYSRDSKREEVLIVAPPATMKKIQNQFENAIAMRSSKRKARRPSHKSSLMGIRVSSPLEVLEELQFCTLTPSITTVEAELEPMKLELRMSRRSVPLIDRLRVSL
jgi:hypothetical protein